MLYPRPASPVRSSPLTVRREQQGDFSVMVEPLKSFAVLVSTKRIRSARPFPSRPRQSARNRISSAGVPRRRGRAARDASPDDSPQAARPTTPRARECSAASRLTRERKASRNRKAPATSNPYRRISGLSSEPSARNSSFMRRSCSSIAHRSSTTVHYPPTTIHQNAKGRRLAGLDCKKNAATS